MFDFVRKSLLLGLGAVSVTKEKAEVLVDELVKRGEITSEESKKMVSALIEKGEEMRDELSKIVKREMEKFRFDVGLATHKDIERLEDRIKFLEEQLNSNSNSNKNS